MNILAIDTSNETMGVAVLKEGQLAGEYITKVKKNHSVRLLPAIDQIMRETEVNPKDLDKIVVAKGPGSYTGVRIGLSTAKTMAWTLNIPIVAVSSLEVVAYQSAYLNKQVCPFFDARRGLVYTGLYQSNDKGNVTLLWDEINISFEKWLERLAEEGKPTVFLSQDVDIHKGLIEEYMGDLAIIPESMYHLPRPSLLALAGAGKQPDSLHTLTPNYLRLVEAEAKWLEKQEKSKDD
ncbi:tRNA (adenosine(37)-N6)-threonylcarbamoyltransferase complex dimerization subunit type 1 TsaB [Aquibacillus rhizosphaerae]|uniref:tRNA (Adenosine(37)-N6)-threonylcarbamoyltransferase complex dimerization subunit type 1 TsaB n=1 Tax=Aquibacillus rhizosphaerae TaxID=3051431 RepID=A0ABT7L7W1_9BACI|nr:tRNA (adenosine(37)-N6)-threonylcarbamoyltransferase complex dimerization subunit type 1 TsaB [Aquibacillus sp. LR5S19]MDL4841949.1 tRNA (adenosine(37)-N6)-threonylcarbamoyltransferase complex dimerization subunit type 1 TsaB [Aquibacillus sp. LR5S19]